ncbi:MAG TPA: PhzF family phenazine biosynthesis protein [Patescibacteria group bacterium]|nr:PhzF family phenazine biosynthesis protein [Patescibacteria group bacterium]
MHTLIMKQVDAFTTNPFSGNPAGVITEADGVTLEMMQKIASEMNLSETAFVTMPESGDTMFRLRFFTPVEEVDMSGHVTIAVCYALIEEGRIPLMDGITKVFLGTNIGSMPIDIHFTSTEHRFHSGGGHENGVALFVKGTNTGTLEKIMMHQPIQDSRPSSIPIGSIASILGIDEIEIRRTGLPLEIISTGLDQLMIPVQHKETILNMHPDLIKLNLLNRTNRIHTNHIFTLDTFHDDCIAYARHFAPAVGLWEDPGTGTAAAGLGTYLLRHGIITHGAMVMEQGKEMDSLTRILVEIDESGGDSLSAWIGGVAITSLTRTIEVTSSEIVIV